MIDDKLANFLFSFQVIKACVDPCAPSNNFRGP